MRLCVLDLCEDAFEIDLLFANVLDLLWPGGLALDADRTLIARCAKAAEDLGEVDLALADKDLLAELGGIRRPLAVLRVHGTHMGAKDLHRIDRVGFAIENQ